MARAGQKLLEHGFLQECAREEGLGPEQAYHCVYPSLPPESRQASAMPCCGTSLEEQVPNVLIGEYDIRRALADYLVTRCLTCTYSDVFAHESECAACEHRYECGRCPASSLQHGSIYARDTFACRIMKGGYMEERVRRIMESDDSERKNESVMADAGAKR